MNKRDQTKRAKVRSDLYAKRAKADVGKVVINLANALGVRPDSISDEMRAALMMAYVYGSNAGMERAGDMIQEMNYE